MSHIRQKIKLFQYLDKIFDSFLVIAAIYLSIIFESIYHSIKVIPINYNSFAIEGIILSIFVFIITISIVEHNFFYRISNYFSIIKNVFFINTFSLLFIISIDFLFKSSLFYRTSLIVLYFILFLLLLLKRCFVKMYLSKIRREGMDYKNIMIIGYNDSSVQLIKYLESHKEYGMKIACIIDEKPENINSIFKTGTISEVYKFVKNMSIDDVFLCSKIDENENISNMLSLFKCYGISIHVAINDNYDQYFLNDNIKPVFENYFGVHSITYNSIAVSYYKLVLKNFFERTFSILMLFFLFPLIILSLFLVLVSTKSFPIFIQKRVGLRGRIFNQYKIRTMVVNAESQKDKLKYMNELDGPIFKIENDPRITGIGKFLRKFSIDELLQLINVVKGDMNLVGPRPYPVEEVNNFNDESFYRRHSMKPGITGLWQIKGRSDIVKFEDCIKLDLEYIDRWSFCMDLYIAFMTIPVILKGTGK